MADGTVRVGIVLGAGGATGGAFHAGVLAALEDATGWDPRHARVVVGTSAGSIAAAGLRAGLSASDMLARTEGRPMSSAGMNLMRNVGPPRDPPALRAARQARRPAEVAASLARAAAQPFAARPWALVAGLMPEGTVSTDLISDGIGALFPKEWPAEPLWICAVRQQDGRRVVFGRETRPALADAVAASCAIPGFFQPVVVDGDAYIDGGAHSPTNADVVLDTTADLDLDLVIVSSPMSLSGRNIRLSADQPARRWSRALLDAEALRLRRRGIPVVAFQPTAADASVMGINAMDPSRRAAVARQARESTLRRLARSDTRARLAPLFM